MARTASHLEPADTVVTKAMTTLALHLALALALHLALALALHLEVRTLFPASEKPAVAVLAAAVAVEGR